MQIAQKYPHTVQGTKTVSPLPYKALNLTKSIALIWNKAECQKHEMAFLKCHPEIHGSPQPQWKLYQSRSSLPLGMVPSGGRCVRTSWHKRSAWGWVTWPSAGGPHTPPLWPVENEDNVNTDQISYSTYSVFMMEHSKLRTLPCLLSATHLKVCPSTWLAFTLVTVVHKSPLRAIKNKPTFLPGAKLGAQLVEVTTAGCGGHMKVGAQLNLVSCTLYVLLQVKILLWSYGEITSEWPLWGTQNGWKH